MAIRPYALYDDQGNYITLCSFCDKSCQDYIQQDLRKDTIYRVYQFRRSLKKSSAIAYVSEYSIKHL
ncbi:MAG: hypothetical protein F6K08_04455 [Okeania sp. SIO1H6]|nr:hypothetical protein [Okeania sp. SIO1H6]